MNLYGSPLVSASHHGSLLVYTSLYGYPLVSASCQESPLVFVGLNRSPLVSVNLHESPLVFVGIHWSPRLSMGLHEVHGSVQICMCLCRSFMSHCHVMSYLWNVLSNESSPSSFLLNAVTRRNTNVVNFPTFTFSPAFV